MKHIIHSNITCFHNKLLFSFKKVPLFTLNETLKVFGDRMEKNGKKNKEKKDKNGKTLKVSHRSFIIRKLS